MAAPHPRRLRSPPVPIGRGVRGRSGHENMDRRFDARRRRPEGNRMCTDGDRCRPARGPLASTIEQRADLFAWRFGPRRTRRDDASSPCHGSGDRSTRAADRPARTLPAGRSRSPRRRQQRRSSTLRSALVAARSRWQQQRCWCGPSVGYGASTRCHVLGISLCPSHFFPFFISANQIGQPSMWWLAMHLRSAVHGHSDGLGSASHTDRQ